MGVTVDCSDLDDPCLEPRCDPATGACGVRRPDGTVCDDGDLCNGRESCVRGVCTAMTGTAITCAPLEGARCRERLCIPETGGCEVVAHDDSTGCDDGDACTVDDVCRDGVCGGEAVVCSDDGDPCTSDTCRPEDGVCNWPLVDGTPVPDDDLCDGVESCQGGVLVEGAPVVCEDDGNPCTVDVCDPARGVCGIPGPDGPLASDDPCDGRAVCRAGVYVPGEPVVCGESSDPCWRSACDPALGTCRLQPADGVACDDGEVCTTDDVCTDGTCSGTLDLDCDENCTTQVACGGECCPRLAGNWTYAVACNEQQHCEYTNIDQEEWGYLDVWIWVRPGSFEMGRPEEEDRFGRQLTARPIHTVTFAEGFFIGKYEAAVLLHEACVAEGECEELSDYTEFDLHWSVNRTSNGRGDHPQNALDYHEARDLCMWLGPGGRLLSESEWEYAASGPIHRMYPWGDEPEPDCDRVNYDHEPDNFAVRACDPCSERGCSGTRPVWERPAGASYVGAWDMIGNVSEWCGDCWHEDYVGAPIDGSTWSVDCRDPYNMSVRGAATFDYAHGLLFLVAHRGPMVVHERWNHHGVRCGLPSTLAEF